MYAQEPYDVKRSIGLQRHVMFPSTRLVDTGTCPNLIGVSFIPQHWRSKIRYGNPTCLRTATGQPIKPWKLLDYSFTYMNRGLMHWHLVWCRQHLAVNILLSKTYIEKRIKLFSPWIDGWCLHDCRSWQSLHPTRLHDALQPQSKTTWSTPLREMPTSFQKFKQTQMPIISSMSLKLKLYPHLWITERLVISILAVSCYSIRERTQRNQSGNCCKSCFQPNVLMT